MFSYAGCLPYLYLLSGLAVLYFGAEWLVGASARLAVRFGVKPLLVGVTVVALGTSAPEFVVSVQSALGGIGGIAMGNVVGSNICNTALVLGLSALICPVLVTRQFFKFDIPVLIGASFLAWFFLSDSVVQVWEGVVLMVFFTGYMAFNIANAKAGGGGVDAEVATVVRGGGKKISVVKNTRLVLLGLAMLVAGAELLVRGAVKIAESFKVSEAVIGLTIVAFGTSLPELATSVVAAVRKHNDIAVGNVVGSNLFNILCILGVVGAMGPIETGGVSSRDMLFMSLINIVLFAPLITGSIINRWIGGLLTGAYVAYILMLALGL
jgi:cation:H+ antiporter